LTFRIYRYIHTIDPGTAQLPCTLKTSLAALILCTDSDPDKPGQSIGGRTSVQEIKPGHITPTSRRLLKPPIQINSQRRQGAMQKRRTRACFSNGSIASNIMQSYD
jgi:hypothetical protein